MMVFKLKPHLSGRLDRHEVIFDAKPGTPEGDELEVSGVLNDNRQEPVKYLQLV
jgi:HTH-type transcriptional regulator/antitoxin HigA